MNQLPAAGCENNRSKRLHSRTISATIRRPASAGILPAYMPGYANAEIGEATRLNEEASHKFDEGTEARETGENYVRNTVLFATVLFLVALAQRQKARGARIAANGIAVALLVFTMISTVNLDRL